MLYIVNRRLTVNGITYEPGDRIEGATLKHEAYHALRRDINLVPQSEVMSQSSPPPDPLALFDEPSPLPLAKASERLRGRA